MHHQSTILETAEESPVIFRDKRAEGRNNAAAGLLKTLSSEAGKRRRRRHWYKAGAVALVALIALTTFILEGKLRFKIGDYWITLAAVAVYEILATRRERQTARKLAELDDPRALGPLIDALELQGDTFSDGSTIAVVKDALARLLPRADADLTARQLNILAEHALNPIENSELALGTIRTIERHKHTEAREEVGQFVDGSGPLADAARACYAALEAEEARLRAAETLLRPSESTVENNLLRAANPAPSAGPADLLRPMGGAGNDGS